MEKVRLKPIHTAATDRSFFDLFRPIIPTLSKTGVIAQIISGITEAVTVWLIVQSEMAAAPKLVAILSSIAAMILVVAILELGGRKFLQVLTRVVVWWRFENLWYILLFAIVLTVSITIVGLSFRLSTTGIHHTFTSSAREKVERFDDSVFRQRQMEDVAGIESRYDATRSNIERKHAEKIEAIKGEYKAQIKAAKDKQAYHSERAAKGVKWAESHANKWKRKSIELEEAMAAAVSRLTGEKVAELERHAADRSAAITQSKAVATTTLSAAMEEHKAANEATMATGAFLGNLFGGLVGACVVLAYVCIITVEIFKRGSGIETTHEEQKVEPGVWKIAAKALVERANYLVQRYVYILLGIHSTNTSQRKIGFATPTTSIANAANQLNLKNSTEKRLNGVSTPSQPVSGLSEHEVLEMALRSANSFISSYKSKTQTARAKAKMAEWQGKADVIKRRMEQIRNGS
jgi:hypothetical protein